VTDPEPLSEDDWRLLLTGSLPKTYDLDEPILEEGQFNYHLFRYVADHDVPLNESR